MPEETRVFRHELLGEIRTVLLDDVRWFNVMDLCDQNGYSNAAAVMTRVWQRDMQRINCATEFGPWRMWFVTERGAYYLTSNRRRWEQLHPEDKVQS